MTYNKAKSHALYVMARYYLAEARAEKIAGSDPAVVVELARSYRNCARVYRDMDLQTMETK